VAPSRALAEKDHLAVTLLFSAVPLYSCPLLANHALGTLAKVIDVESRHELVMRKEVSDCDFEVRGMSPCDPIFWVVRGSGRDSCPCAVVYARGDCLGDMTDSISAHCLSSGCERTDLASTIAKLVLWRNIAWS
jgi:hypothetical protein